MTQPNPTRWGIISTANIARSAFLPALRTAGGTAFAVAGRNLERARRFAEENGVEHAIEGYANLLADDQVEAVYIALPNSLHAEWTIAALRAGKAVLCEKPLCVSLQETEEVLQEARRSSGLLWEAFVFPFRPQTGRLQDIIHSGEIGELREVQANFHFKLTTPDNIRYDPALGGGAFYDVGCYCIRFGRLLLGEATAGTALARWTDQGVDLDLQGVLEFPVDRRLLFSCGMSRPPDTFARVIGSEGEVRLSNPYHSRQADTLEVRHGGEDRVERPSNDEPSFTDALRHIQAVLGGEEAPRHLALDEAAGNAAAIDLLYRKARQQAASSEDATG